jgi:hypothetical protein
VFIQTRRRTLSVTIRLLEGVIAAVTETQIQEVPATHSSTRLSTTRSLSDQRGPGLRQFRQPSARAPTLSLVVPQFAQGKARMHSSLSLPLWTPHPPSQTTQIIVAQCIRHLRYTPQRRARSTQELRKRFNLCIFQLVFTYNHFCEPCFILRTRSPAFLSFGRLALFHCIVY